MASGIVPSPSLNTDWCLSTASNVHIAKDSAWFINYEPISSQVQSVVGGGDIRVIGIGDAIVPVKIRPKRTGPTAHGTLVFKDVLHVPGAACNIVGMARDDLPFASATFGGGEHPGALYDAEGHRLATMRQAKPTTLPALVLSGPPYGPGLCATTFQQGNAYIVSVRWSEEERQRWTEYKRTLEQKSETLSIYDSDGDDCDQPPYNEEELAWLQEHFGGETVFLKLASVSEKNRSLGREIMRGIKNRVMPRMEELSASEDGPRGPAPTPADLVRAMASEFNAGLFDEYEHEFLDESFGGYENFMEENGFKFGDAEAMVEAKSLVRSMMGLSSDDDSDDLDTSDADDEEGNIGGPADYFFTESEVRFMRREGGSTEHFMMMHGLKFYKEEDCEEAKAVIRALRSMD